MIDSYACDSENEPNKFSNDASIIIDKDIEIDTEEASEEQVKSNNLFAFDVIIILIKIKAAYIKLFKGSCTNKQSDDQFLKKFERLKIINKKVINRFQGNLLFIFSNKIPIPII